MKKVLMVFLVTTASIVLTIGIVKAASEYNITSTLGGTSGDFFDLDGTLITDSVKIGAQGTGGVTFFNGTIINTTTSSGAGNPVTFGDDVRIDGRVWRGATAGTSDSMPFIVNDNMEITGSLSINSLASSSVITSANITDGTVAEADLASNSVTSDKISDGTIATTDLADDSVTQSQEATFESGTTSATTTASGGDYDTLEEITITTGANTLFIIFSGYGTVDAVNKSIRFGISLDGDTIDRTVRRDTNSDGEGQINLVTSALVDVSAGGHTLRLLWQTDSGQEATMYAHTFDVIELKK